MQAYATAEPVPLGDQLHTFHCTSSGSVRDAATGHSEPTSIDQLLGRLADLVVDRIAERSSASASDEFADWLDARSAAAYLGMHRDTLRKLAAQRAIPTHQNGPRCKLYFRRDELDQWRRTAMPTSASRLRAVT